MELGMDLGMDLGMGTWDGSWDGNFGWIWSFSMIGWWDWGVVVPIAQKRRAGL